MTDHPEIFAALAAPFPPQAVKERQQGGRTLSYITARTAMNRLDDVLGPENWEDTYIPWNGSGVVCTLTITLPGGRRVSKQGLGGVTEMHDASDTDKTGESDALKRAAVKFGVGRYLYRDGVPEFAAGQAPPPPARDASPPPRRESNGNGGGPAPRSGRALFAWCKKQEEEHGSGLVDAVQRWGKGQGYPFKLIDWDEQQSAAGHAEARRLVADLIASTEGGNDD